MILANFLYEIFPATYRTFAYSSFHKLLSDGIVGGIAKDGINMTIRLRGQDLLAFKRWPFSVC